MHLKKCKNKNKIDDATKLELVKEKT